MNCIPGVEPWKPLQRESAIPVTIALAATPMTRLAWSMNAGPKPRSDRIT